jgi:hypothetical protein
VPIVKIPDETHTAAQTAAPDIYQTVMRLQALLHEEIELEFPDLVPGSANGLPVSPPHAKLPIQVNDNRRCNRLNGIA